VVLENGRRPFNDDYLALMRHYGMTPRTTEVGEKEQNGDVEAGNGARVAIQEARTALALAWRYMDAFETEAAALYAAPMELDAMRDFAARLVKADDKTASATARRGRQQQASSIVKLWTSSPTIAPGTRWAAYNAVTEYLDHFQPVRGARTSRAAADTRALRAVTPGSGVETLKLDAFRLLQTT